MGWNSGLRALSRELRAVWNDDAGPTAVEYALLAGLIAVVIVATVSALGNAVVDLFTDDELRAALE